MLYLVDGYNMIGAWPEFKSCADFSQESIIEDEYDTMAIKHAYA